MLGDCLLMCVNEGSCFTTMNRSKKNFLTSSSEIQWLEEDFCDIASDSTLHSGASENITASKLYYREMEREKRRWKREGFIGEYSSLDSQAKLCPCSATITAFRTDALIFHQPDWPDCACTVQESQEKERVSFQVSSVFSPEQTSRPKPVCDVPLVILLPSELQLWEKCRTCLSWWRQSHYSVHWTRPKSHKRADKHGVTETHLTSAAITTWLKWFPQRPTFSSRLQNLRSFLTTAFQPFFMLEMIFFNCSTEYCIISNNVQLLLFLNWYIWE